jgi:hypothetical protein
MLWADGMRNQVSTRSAGDGRQRLDPRPLLRERTGGDVPVRQAPIDRPAQRDAVDREHVVHQLPSSAALGVRERHHRRVGRGQNGVAPPSGNADAGVTEDALAADALGQHAKRGAIDAGHEFDGPGCAARDQRLGFRRQHRIEAPRPGRCIERQREVEHRHRRAIGHAVQGHVVDHEIDPPNRNDHRLTIGRRWVDVVFTNEQQVAVRWGQSGEQQMRARRVARYRRWRLWNHPDADPRRWRHGVLIPATPALE